MANVAEIKKLETLNIRGVFESLHEHMTTISLFYDEASVAALYHASHKWEAHKRRVIENAIASPRVRSNLNLLQHVPSAYSPLTQRDPASLAPFAPINGSPRRHGGYVSPRSKILTAPQRAVLDPGRASKMVLLNSDTKDIMIDDTPGEAGASQRRKVRLVSSIAIRRK